MTNAHVEYPPYDPDAECTKCGHDVVTTRYFVSREHGEGLHRCCDRCGYGWNEATLADAPKPRSRS